MPIKRGETLLGKQILTILKDHGPLSIELLHRMTEPQAKKINLRQSLSILKKKELIESVNLTSHITFYQISQTLVKRQEAAETLKVNPSDLVQPLLRKQDWIHNQWTEYWIQVIKRRFPECEIVREGSIGGSEISKRVLQLEHRDFELMPDFLIIFPKTSTSDATFIAFEIERTRKSNKRLLNKLRKYLNGTKIDGLVYVCDSGRLSETIRLLYESKLAAQAPRIKHYRDHFFLFSDCLAGGGQGLNRLMNAKGSPLQFSEWCQLLRSTKWTQRRDSSFRDIELSI